ncbi:MAG: glycosyltransferase [Candidatus Aegiribacteria sp.]|nr:glycosyltransferase [Candidatus Aegiribacteria sp.]
MSTKVIYPRVLVFGEGFRDVSGPGLTLTSLFQGWPRDKIVDVHSSTNRNDQVTETHLYLPSRGITSVWKRRSSKKSNNGTDINTKDKNASFTPSDIKQLLRMQLLGRVFWHRAGTSQIIHRIKEFNPEILYVQPSMGLSSAILKLHNILGKIPMVVHIMDDWPGMWSDSPSFKDRLLFKHEHYSFKHILKRAHARMAICPAMADEYKIRYGYNFSSYQRLVQRPERTLLSETRKSSVKLLYVGRIGIAVSKTLVHIAEAVRNMKLKGVNIDLSIISAQTETAVSIGLGDYVDRNGPYPSSEISAIIDSADILLIPLDFSPESLRFAKLSMPSKVPEYLCSGVPCIVIAPKETALARYAIEEGWAIVVTDDKISEIEKAILTLISSSKKQAKLINAASMTYESDYNVEKNRSSFQKIICEAIE